MMDNDDENNEANDGDNFAVWGVAAVAWSMRSHLGSAGGGAPSIRRPLD